MMRCKHGFLPLALSVALVACAGDAPPEGDDTTDPTGDTDAGTHPGNGGTADASSPTTQPGQAAYPSLPYGVATGDRSENRTGIGSKATDADPDDDPFNEPPHQISLADFYRGNDPHSRLLLTIQSAGWCGPCQEEASHLPSVSSQW